MSNILVLTNVTKTFVMPGGSTIPVLRDANLTVRAGQAVAFMGRSGSGKSTLLNLIGLLDRPTSGLLECDGRDTSTLSEGARARMRGAFFGFVFQQFHLIDHRTAIENVAEPLLYSTTRDVLTRHQRAESLLAMVGLEDRLNSMPHLLSGGEQQRVAIARSIARSPRVLCADEPTGALDATTGDTVLNLLFDLVRARGLTLLLATHDPLVAQRADRIIHVRDGQLVEQ